MNPADIPVFILASVVWLAVFLFWAVTFVRGRDQRRAARPRIKVHRQQHHRPQHIRPEGVPRPTLVTRPVQETPRDLVS